MRLSVQRNTETETETPPAAGRAAPPVAAAAARRAPDTPDLSFLARDPASALRSFFDTIDRITRDNPVDVARLRELAGKARSGGLTEAETQELQSLKLHAVG